MTARDRLWLNGFTTASEMLANDILAIEEARQALEEDVIAYRDWQAPWVEGLDAGIQASFGS